MNAPPWRREAVLVDGSEVWIGPSFGIIVPPKGNVAEEIRRMESRMRPQKRAPGPYSGT